MLQTTWQRSRNSKTSIEHVHLVWREAKSSCNGEFGNNVCIRIAELLHQICDIIKLQFLIDTQYLIYCDTIHCHREMYHHSWIHGTRISMSITALVLSCARSNLCHKVSGKSWMLPFWVQMCSYKNSPFKSKSEYLPNHQSAHLMKNILNELFMHNLGHS